jgi:hypothetical protein
VCCGFQDLGVTRSLAWQQFISLVLTSLHSVLVCIVQAAALVEMLADARVEEMDAYREAGTPVSDAARREWLEEFLRGPAMPMLYEQFRAFVHFVEVDVPNIVSYL